MTKDTYSEITRDNFGTSTVIALLKSNALSHKEALRLLEEATHVIVSLRQHNRSILSEIKKCQS